MMDSNQPQKQSYSMHAVTQSHTVETVEWQCTHEDALTLTGTLLEGDTYVLLAAAAHDGDGRSLERCNTNKLKVDYTMP